jgi:NAD(P)-dependent dehydrogenase (short-subunit alcohol dehydrogenase family)
MLLQNFLLVLDTGRTGGIGFQSGLGIASQDASTTVVITGRNLERGQAAVERLQEESKNDNIQLVIGDVSSIAKVNALAADLAKELDHIDVLINNAGYLGSELQKH